MAIPLTQQELDDLEMSKSVMDEPRSGFQKLTDFLFGRTLPEQMTQALATPLGSSQIAKVAPQIADPTVVSRALRAMGREALNYMRKTGQRISVSARNVPGELGSHTNLGRAHIVTLSPKAQEATAFHEITGHAFEDALPFQAKRDFLDAQDALPRPLTRLAMRRNYKADEIPGEAFAYSREPKGAAGAMPMSEGERAYGNQISRAARKDLKEIMRKAFEEDVPVERSLKTELHTRRKTALSGDELQNFLGEMGPKVDPNADVFVKNAQLLENAKALSPTAAKSREAARAALEARKGESSGFAALMEKQPWDVQEQARLEHMDAILRRMKKRNQEFKSQQGGD